MSKETQRDPRDFYIIDTRTPSTQHSQFAKNTGRQFQELDLGANPEYGQMLGLQQKGQLKQAMNESSVDPLLRSRAANFHDMQHMTEEVYKYKTDENGCIWVTDKEDAKRLMKVLRKIDTEVNFLPLGKTLTDQELLSPGPAQSHVPQPTFKK